MSTVVGLQVYDTIPASPEVPCAIVAPENATYHVDLSGSVDLTFQIRVLVQLADWESAQDLLDGYCSTGVSTSIPDAIESLDIATAVTFDGYGVVTLGTEANPMAYGTVVFHVMEVQ